MNIVITRATPGRSLVVHISMKFAKTKICSSNPSIQITIFVSDVQVGGPNQELVTR